MVTQNYKRLLAAILESRHVTSDVTNLNTLTFSDIVGRPFYYLNASSSSYLSFPANMTRTGTSDPTAAGISVGSDDTPASEIDYNLKATLTDVTVTVNSYRFYKDKYYNCVLEYTVSVTNNGANDIVIREIGYKQLFYGRRYRGGSGNYDYTSVTSKVVLLDRTVLDSPITVAPGETGIVVYSLTSSLYGQMVVENIPIVSFQDGTDEEVIAIIDAARQGKIDLQKDAKWCIGDWRTIHMDAFTGGGSTAHAAQDIDVVITSFDNYNDCGCVLQFDILETLATTQRMNGSNTAKYAESEMVSTTLPAIEAALPSWIKSRLVPFDVLYKPSSSATEVSTLTNQKLAIRSMSEIWPTYGGLFEGALVPFYNDSDSRIPARGKGVSNTAGFFTRTPYNSSSFYTSQSGSSNSSSASSAQYIVFFGCI